MSDHRSSYPTDVSDEEWAVVAPYLRLLDEKAGQRDHDLREVFNGLRYVVKTGIPWRFMPHDLPPWAAVYQQMQRWLAADCFVEIASDLRAVLRMAVEREPDPTAAVLDSRTLRSSPESGERAGYDGAKRKNGSKLHLGTDTMGYPLGVEATPANIGDREVVERLTKAIQTETDASVEKAFVDQGYTGEKAAAAARKNGVELEVVRLPEAKHGFVLLPRRWVVERSFGWATRFRRLVKDYERYASTLAGLHMIAFVCLMLKQAALLGAGS